MTDRIGFMQGRLSPLVDGRIQAFPWSCWRDGFLLAHQCGFRLMEWTLDQDRLRENPLMTPDGQDQISALCATHAISIPSLTGDCFMQAPFWKAEGEQRHALLRDFLAVAGACARVGVRTIVVPLVDNGRLETRQQEDDLVSSLQSHGEFFAHAGIRVVFESDFAPQELSRFIERLAPSLFGINYDIGNSAALGFDATDEMAAYGHRILNVHVKDRMLGGTTVPLGTGNADFEAVFEALAGVGFRGNCILQTARAADHDHAGTLCLYRDLTADWLTRHPVNSYAA
jgi:L-ribulose-5-phosphate 3-epimerase